MYLEKINEPGDVKKLNKKELELLCGEIREFLIEKISQNRRPFGVQPWGGGADHCAASGV